eukprot:gene7156-biopygen7550
MDVAGLEGAQHMPLPPNLVVVRLCVEERKEAAEVVEGTVDRCPGDAPPGRGRDVADHLRRPFSARFLQLLRLVKDHPMEL